MWFLLVLYKSNDLITAIGPLFCTIEIAPGVRLVGAKSRFWPHLLIISRRDEVQPVFYHGRTKRQVETTLEGTAASASSKHIHDLTMSFDSRGQKFILDLKLNQNLIPKEYFHKYQTKVRQIIIPIKNMLSTDLKKELLHIPLFNFSLIYFFQKNIRKEKR